MRAVYDKIRIEALELAAKYSFMPNRLKYCGPDDADRVLLDFIITKKNSAGAGELLNQFKALRLYLELIARKNNKEPFDKEVIEAYWIGNELLDNVSNKDIKALILNDFTKHGLPKSAAVALALKTPEGITPHHSFHVLHVNFLTKKVAPTLTNLDKCRISWGKVKQAGENELLVEYVPVITEKDKIRLGAPAPKKIKYYKEFFGQIKQGDVVSFHWDLAIEKLSESRLRNLEKYTSRNIEAMNQLYLSFFK